MLLNTSETTTHSSNFQMDTSPAHACALIRVFSPASACLRLEATGAFIVAELTPPLSPRSHFNAQLVNATAPISAVVSLGPYNIAERCFTKCKIQAQLPAPEYKRVGYAARLTQKEATRGASVLPPPRSVPAQDAHGGGSRARDEC